MAVYIYRIKGASRTKFGEFDGIEDLKTYIHNHNTAIYNGLKAALERGFLTKKEFQENAECLEVKNGK